MSVLSNFLKSLACWRSPGGGGYQVYGSSSCPAMGKFRHCALCVGLVLISLVLITSYYMGDNEYRQKLSEIKHPPHARVRRPEGCGYQACHPIKPGYLNVHIIPHSHDDMGWLKTAEEYYTGEGDPSVPWSVRRIIGSSVEALRKDPERRFIQVETGFFSMWWKEQNESTRGLVRELVNSGRLEFTGGAWAMNDEATAHYASILDGFSVGLRTLNETFGRCGVPRVGWQIDPFGHSKEMASLFAQMGYEAFMFSRIDYQDVAKRQQEKGMQMLWEASKDLGKSSHIFTEMINNVYNPPNGYCFDIICHIQFIDDETSPMYNAKRLATKYLDWVRDQSKQFRSPNIPALFGGDFTYQDAEYYYRSLDKLIKYINNMQSNGSKINLLYSTPSCYIKAVHESGISLPTKQDDFFPYGSGSHAYWTGFFTSRPALKRYERFGYGMLQVCKQLYVLSNLRSDPDHNHESDLALLREAMAVLQHHDGITGTAKQHPSNNYAELVSRGLAACQSVANNAFQNLMKSSGSRFGKPTPVVAELKTCHYLNISSCQHSETWDKFVVNVYNPLGHPVNRYIRIPVKRDRIYSVQDHTGNVLETQVLPIHEKVLQLQERRPKKDYKSVATHELVFRASPPSMGYASYFVASTEKKEGGEGVSSSRERFIGTTKFGLQLHEKTGVIIALVKNNISLPMSQSFGFYIGHESYSGNNDYGEMSSGAYIFKPERKKPSKEPVFTTFTDAGLTVSVYKGPLVDEVHQTHSQPDKSFVSQVIRIYKEEEHVEFEWLVGPIPVDDRKGKEVVTRYQIPSFNSENRFFTDSSGREMVERIRDYRPTWQLDNTEPVASNYYPVTSRISVRDDVLQMSVLTDRAQGGTSLNKGEIELMIHRRLLRDDGKGVEEPLNEPGTDGKGLVVRGSHWLTVGERPTQAALDKTLATEFLLRPWLFFAQAHPDTSFTQWQNHYNMLYSGMRATLPTGVHVLTLEPWTDGTLLLRLEHTLEGDDHPELSKPVSVNLYNFFEPFHIESIYETSLGGNQWYQDVRRMEWTQDRDFLSHYNTSLDTAVDRSYVDVTNITLTPMMIRTFILTVYYTG